MANKIQHVNEKDLLEILSGAPTEAATSATPEKKSSPGQVMKRKPGRPKGAKNKVKRIDELFSKDDRAMRKAYKKQEGWDYSKSSSTEMQRERRYRFTPQFTISRKDAYEMLFKYLRSVKGRLALRNMILHGFAGVGELTDEALENYIENENLISKTRHEVVIQG